MAEDHIDSLRLSLMQDLLPVGLAIVARAKKGGARKLMEVFKESTTPLEELRMEGERDAKIIRDRLDQVSPGLGNPIMSVSVAVDEPVSDISTSDEDDSLRKLLSGIEDRLDLLENQLEAESEHMNNSLED